MAKKSAAAAQLAAKIAKLWNKMQAMKEEREKLKDLYEDLGYGRVCPRCGAIPNQCVC